MAAPLRQAKGIVEAKQYILYNAVSILKEEGVTIILSKLLKNKYIF